MTIIWELVYHPVGSCLLDASKKGVQWLLPVAVSAPWAHKKLQCTKRGQRPQSMSQLAWNTQARKFTNRILSVLSSLRHIHGVYYIGASFVTLFSTSGQALSSQDREKLCSGARKMIKKMDYSIRNQRMSLVISKNGDTWVTYSFSESYRAAAPSSPCYAARNVSAAPSKIVLSSNWNKSKADKDILENHLANHIHAR